MSTSTTIKPEELQTLQGFQVKFRMLSKQYGEAYFQQKLLDKELKDVDAQMDLLEDNRLNYMQELQTKYGVGTVDITTGEFIPAPELVPTP